MTSSKQDAPKKKAPRKSASGASPKKRAVKPPVSRAEDDSDEHGPTSIVRISTTLHRKIRVLAAYEGKPIRELLDNMIGEQIDESFRAKGITFSER